VTVNGTDGPHTPDPKNHRLRFDPLQLPIIGGARTAVFVLQAPWCSCC
jgi:hypothetical protein